MNDLKKILVVEDESHLAKGLQFNLEREGYMVSVVDNGESAIELLGEQVFDLMSEGKFYLVTDNVRPYVEHDYPFEAQTIISERLNNLEKMVLDNSDAFQPAEGRHPSSILKGPMFQEISRLNQTKTER